METISQIVIFNYQWRHPKVKPVAKQANLPESISVGEKVWVKLLGSTE